MDIAAAGGLESFLDELAAALAKRGLGVELGPGGRVTDDEHEVGRVTRWESDRVTLEWRGADWAPEDVTELDLRAEGAASASSTAASAGRCGATRTSSAGLRTKRSRRGLPLRDRGTLPSGGRTVLRGDRSAS